MEEDKVNWKNIKILSDGTKKFVIDDLTPTSWEEWKPKVWYGYNEKGEVIYNKFKDEE